MQHGRKTAIRMHRDVDGEIARFDLLSGGTQRPLIGQEHRTIGLRPGPQIRSVSSAANDTGT